MSSDEATDYADDALLVSGSTTPEDIHAFVESRGTDPIQIRDVTIWNFNNHEVNRPALRKQVDDFIHDEFMIPFNASGVWGYMLMLLPERLQRAEILTYQQTTGKYVPYPNYYRHSKPDENAEVRGRVEQFILNAEI